MKNTIHYIIHYSLLIVLCIFFLTTGCSNPPNEVAGETETQNHDEKTRVTLSETQYKIAEIEVGKPEEKTLSKVLKANGVMDAPPQNLVSVSAPLGGFVVATDLLQGMEIKKGQVLAVMEHPDYVQLQQDYLDKKNHLEYLSQEYKRQEELFAENVNSSKIFQKAKTDFFSMKVQVRGLQEKLAIIGIDAAQLSEENLSRKINLYAPINGYVSAVNVNIGTYANPTDVMFEIVNTEHLHAELTVYEKDVSKLNIGQRVWFTLPNDNKSERLAFIYLIGRKIDADRSVRVHAHLEKEDINLLPGMYINARIELNQNKAMAIPEEAVVLSDGTHFVYVLKGQQSENGEKMYSFEMQKVQKGVTEAGYTEILFPQDMNPTELTIVTKGAFSLLSKIKNTEEE